MSTEQDVARSFTNSPSADVIRKHTLDLAVVRIWTEHCALYRARTRWVWTVAFLLCVVGPLGILLAFGAPAAPLALGAFFVGALLMGVAMSIHTPLLFCPHCGKRPTAVLFSRRSPLRASYCGHCLYWLRMPATRWG